jgi:hypothetical protein
MLKLNQAEKTKIYRKAQQSPALAIMEAVEIFRVQMENCLEEMSNKLPETALLKRIEAVKGDDGMDADEEEIIERVVEVVLGQIPAPEDGKTPTEEELISLIKPLIPKPIKGDKGDDADEHRICQKIMKAIQLPKDGKTPTKEELIDLIRPLIPKVKDGSPDTGEQIIDKINGAPAYKMIPASRISGLPRESRKPFILKGAGSDGATSSDNFADDEVPTGSVDGINTTFVLAQTPSPASSVKVFQNGTKRTLATDYTFSGMTITFLVAPETGDIITVDYRY